ncbi:polymorphic toxin type 27 domain-containing protein [Streptomyces sp. NPDC088729]|uniref:polymorphic toxin type 27 domain-containing protein n=1 Tax=Streptomyces sp. NPDC088729 TaxID=3365876 RepID=UPI0038098E3B
MVLGVNRPGGHSNNLAAHLRNIGDPGAHTYNDSNYGDEEPGGPVWMTNVASAVNDRDTTLSITLDGMPNRSGDSGNWNTPETIIEAFRVAVERGDNFGLGNRDRWPDAGNGTAWEMSVVARAVRAYETDVADGYVDPDGRPWEEISWYSGNARIHIDKPDIMELNPEYLRLKREQANGS